MIQLVDERSRHPVRERIGALLTRASAANFAVSRIRLAALDLSAGELAGVRECRVLLGRLDVGMLLDAADAPGAGEWVAPSRAARRLEVLTAFASSGRLAVRAAGLDGWVPDFSVYRSAEGRSALLGAHFFGSTEPIAGPSFTAIIEDAAAIERLASRYEELWRRGHDVLPAIREVLERAHALALDAAGRGRGADRADAAG